MSVFYSTFTPPLLYQEIQLRGYESRHQRKAAKWNSFFFSQMFDLALSPKKNFCDIVAYHFGIRYVSPFMYRFKMLNLWACEQKSAQFSDKYKWRCLNQLSRPLYGTEGGLRGPSGVEVIKIIHLGIFPSHQRILLRGLLILLTLRPFRPTWKSDSERALLWERAPREL